MKREEYDSPFHPSTIANPQEVAAFEKSTRRAHCCGIEDFRIDIDKGALNKWNRSASIVFARAFVDSGEYQCDDEDAVAAAFLTHVRTLRKKYRETGLTTIQIRHKQKRANRDQRKITVSRLGLSSIVTH